MSRTPTADFWFSIVLTVFGAAIMFESWRMPRLQDIGINPLSAPGLTPGLLGVVLTGLALTLLVRSIGSAPPGEAGEGGWGRFAVTLALCLGYALVLVGRMPFWLATGLFLTAFVTTFLWPRLSPVRAGLSALVLAVVGSAAITLLFQQVFLVQLP